MAIELVPLCTIRLQARPPVEVGAGPAGTRMIFEIASVQVKGGPAERGNAGCRSRRLGDCRS
jgi:hypothetical protein